VHSAHAKNWKDLRAEKIKFEKTDPTVLIVGAGQNGLMIAARLNALGIANLVLDKNDQVCYVWLRSVI